MTVTKQATESTVSPPALEIAEVIDRYGDLFLQRYGDQLHDRQQRALRELAVCRTAALGGHLNQCDQCDQQTQGYNSCRNRHCPKCPEVSRHRWLASRRQETLPVEYFHVVFTLPDELAQLSIDNAYTVYHTLCREAANAIIEVGRRWSVLQAQMGATVVLHSWGQLLNRHPHAHCLVPGGGLSRKDGRWVSLPRATFLPKRWLMSEFRQRFLQEMRKRYRQGRLLLRGELAHLNDPADFERWIGQLEQRVWMVHAVSVTERHARPQETTQTRPQCGGSKTAIDEQADRVVKYLARYASGMVISNHRLISMEDGQVAFWYKDHRHRGRRKVARIPALEFLDRFLSHVLPKNMSHVRSYGFLAPTKRKASLEKIRQQLGASGEDSPDEGEHNDRREPEDDDWRGRCPHCGAKAMVRISETPRPTVAEFMATPIFPYDFQQLKEAAAKPRQLELGFT